ncbi:MAG: Spx/MgsR family RNA polymerase-binding regulatory protein [Minwuia sp.]|uniref:Spx/MgsR family RNA polymerase-binding regulatory protein n=1 Tax=Minwuia sp. TaxID=2493630 RepID=UPI003A89D827
MSGWTVYGLKNCDTCRKARRWLNDEGIVHRFIDVRDDGISEAQVARWAAAVDPSVLINRRGTTWRGLPEGERAGADSGEGAARLGAAHPALIKRPVFESGARILVGFTDDVKAELKG